MSLTSTLFSGLEALTAIPGGPYAAAGYAAVAGGSAIALVWWALPHPRPDYGGVPVLTGPRPGTITMEKTMTHSPLDIPLDVVPREEGTGRTAYDIVGVDAIRVAVDQFYSCVCSDPDLVGFFKGVDIERVKRHQTLLIGQLWGGPVAFPLKALADAHANLSITPEIYWKVVGHLMVTLTRLGVPDWVAIFTMTRLYQARSLIISADNPLDPEDVVEPDSHPFSPRPGQAHCSYSVGDEPGKQCGEDGLHPVHYAPAPADADAGGRP